MRADQKVLHLNMKSQGIYLEMSAKISPFYVFTLKTSHREFAVSLCPVGAGV